MSRFVLTAQLQLQAPTNTAQVVRQIQNQLNNVQVNLQVQGTAQATRQVNQVAQSINAANTAASNLGRTFAISVRRFTALAVATRAVSLFTNTLSKATEEAIQFERELIRISQVTGKSVKNLRELTKTITDLSTSLGVSSSSLIGISRILSQAGFNAKQTEIALRTLAKTELAPTFDNITDTAEGAVAIFNQFRLGAEALEEQLGSINAVAGRFAVEAGDLIGAVRRVGGVFKASGGDLNELIALFTSVRATTRESAESIATGLRTIFTRIQRPKTIEFLKRFGVELVDLEGKFVGPFEATRRLSEALAGLEQGDITFIKIAEELGGFRQIGKVIPLLQQFRVAQDALNVAQKGGKSLTDDAASAQAALAVRIIKVKEEFLALVRSITETSSFQIFANTALNLASSLIKLADALKPIIPLLTAVAGIRLAQGLGGFLAGFRGGIGSGRTFNQGGKVLKFARGGMVPGSGNRDTVPAMLQPGEFVIRKSSVNKMGASNLAAMNENRYNRGTTGRGIVGATSQLKSKEKRKSPYGPKESAPGSGVVKFNVNEGQIGAFVLQPAKGTEGSYKPSKPINFVLPPTNKYAQFAAKQAGLDPKQDIAGGINAVLNPGSYPIFYPGMDEGRANLKKNIKYANAVTKGFNDAISTGVNSTIQSVTSQGLLDLPPAFNTDENLLKNTIASIQSDGQVRSSIEGYLFEGMISAFTGAQAAGGRANFDFPRSAISQNKDKLATLFGSAPMINKLIKAEAKRSYGEVSGVTNKLINDIKADKKGGVSIQTIGKRFASGGSVGTDTVPALLTPGEFVVNKKSAQAIGYGSLNRMNKVGKYATGGTVGVFGAKKFARGGQASGGGNIFSGFGSQLTLVSSALQSMVPPVDENSTSLQKLSSKFLSLTTQIGAAIFALQAFGLNLNAKNIAALFGSGPGSIGGIFKAGFKGLSGGATFADKKNILKSGPLASGSYRAGGFLRSGVSSVRRGINENLYGAKSINQKTSFLGQSFSSGFSGARQGINPLFAAAKSRNPFVGTGGSAGLKALQTGISQLGFGGRLAANAGGFLGKGVLGSGIAKVGGLASRGAGLVGSAGGAIGGGLAAAAGPAAAVTGVIAVINSVVGSFRDLDAGLERAIKAGETEEAVRLSIAKKASEFPIIGNIVSSIFGQAGDEFLIGIAQIFGGATLDSITALAQVQVGAAKAQKDLITAQKIATDSMEDFTKGNITASEALARIRESTKSVEQQQKKASDFAISNTQNFSTGGSAVARNIFTLGGLLGESSSARNTRLGKESAQQIEQSSKFEAERFQLESSARQATIRSAAARGSSAEDISSEAIGGLKERRTELLKTARSLYARGDTEGAAAAEAAAKQLGEQIDSVNREVDNIVKEVKRAREAFEAMNLGLRSASATATAASASLTRFQAGLEVGGSTLVADVEFLATAMTSAAQAMNPEQIKSAIDNVSGTLERFGVNEQFVNKFRSNTDAFIKAQQNYGASVKNIIERNKEAGKSLSPEQFKTEIADELTRGLDGVAAENLKKVINNIELDDDELSKVLAGDISVFGDKLQGATAKQFEELGKIAKELQQAERVLIDLTKKRIDAERNLIQAQKDAIDLYMEGREVQAAAGGATVTSTERRSSIIRKANLELGGAGLGNLGAGNANDFRNVNRQLLQRTGEFQGKARTDGGLSGVEGVKAAEQQANLEKAYKSQIDTIRQLIKLEQDELKLIKEKNRLEQSSIDALISGDIDKFFEEQAAVAGQAAIALGSDVLQNALGARALGAAAQDIRRQQDAGVQELFGQRLAGSGGLTERAYRSATGAMGVTDPRLARVAAGTTAEENAANARLQELGGLLGEMGDVGTAMAAMEVQTATMNVAKAEIILADVTRRGNEAAASIGLSQGGPVYASRGIFVPRGTDTVPAMLTPGEFVVRRSAVQRGNNLQMLQAMNRGQSQPSSNLGSAVGMARGGLVKYYDGGGQVDGGVGFGLSAELINKFSFALDNFNTELGKNIDRLNNTSFNIKLDTTNVNVNLNGGTFLAKLKDDLRKELMEEVGEQIASNRVGEGGSLRPDSTVLGRG